MAHRPLFFLVLHSKARCGSRDRSLFWGGLTKKCRDVKKFNSAASLDQSLNDIKTNEFQYILIKTMISYRFYNTFPFRKHTLQFGLFWILESNVYSGGGGILARSWLWKSVSYTNSLIVTSRRKCSKTRGNAYIVMVTEASAKVSRQKAINCQKLPRATY